ncbi:MAG: acyltransferase [Anaerolineae bacterium]|nr:acyltransferase [Anaerolineae bacterium]
MNRVFPALRGIAILLVVLNHTIHMGTVYPKSLGLAATLAAAPWERWILYSLSGLGSFAVPIFLYLSGSFFSYAARQDDLRANYRIVWVNLKNIVIPYVLWSSIFYLEIFLVHHQTCTPLECIKQLIVGYPFNFIPLLIFYYLISPFLVFATRRWGWIPALVIGVLQLLLINILYPGTLGFAFPGWFSHLTPPVLASTLADWAVYFPLGLLYAQHAADYLPAVRRYRWMLATLVVITFFLALLDSLELVHLPLANYLFPFFFILLAPIFDRRRIPAVKTVENIGKRAYGIYFMNLIVLDLLVVTLVAFIPGVFQYYLLILVPLFCLALLIPLGIMKLVERIQHPPIYRYVFG